MGPTASALGLAEHELLAAVRSMDWSTSPASGREPDAAARALVRALLRPLVPTAFANALAET
jgi:hypothetical protein